MGGLKMQPPSCILDPSLLHLPQYMMLSGQVPFQGSSGQGGQSQAAEIMCKIREGRFSLDGEAWQGVSEEAKELVRGAELEDLGMAEEGVCVRQASTQSDILVEGRVRGQSKSPFPACPCLATRATDSGPSQAAEAGGAARQLVASGRQRALFSTASDARCAGVLWASCALWAQRHFHGKGQTAGGRSPAFDG